MASVCLNINKMILVAASRRPWLVWSLLRKFLFLPLGRRCAGFTWYPPTPHPAKLFFTLFVYCLQATKTRGGEWRGLLLLLQASDAAWHRSVGVVWVVQQHTGVCAGLGCQKVQNKLSIDKYRIFLAVTCSFCSLPVPVTLVFKRSFFRFFET